MLNTGTEVTRQETSSVLGLFNSIVDGDFVSWVVAAVEWSCMLCNTAQDTKLSVDKTGDNPRKTVQLGKKHKNRAHSL